MSIQRAGIHDWSPVLNLLANSAGVWPPVPENNYRPVCRCAMLCDILIYKSSCPRRGHYIVEEYVVKIANTYTFPWVVGSAHVLSIRGQCH